MDIYVAPLIVMTPMRAQPKTDAQPSAVELDRTIRSEDAALLLRWFYPPMSLYIAYTRDDYWIGTGYAPPRSASSCGWGQAEIIDEIQKADDVTPMKLVEAPMWDLVGHNP